MPAPAYKPIHSLNSLNLQSIGLMTTFIDLHDGYKLKREDTNRELYWNRYNWFPSRVHYNDVCNGKSTGKVLIKEGRGGVVVVVEWRGSGSGGGVRRGSGSIGGKSGRRRVSSSGGGGGVVALVVEGGRVVAVVAEGGGLVALVEEGGVVVVIVEGGGVVVDGCRMQGNLRRKGGGVIRLSLPESLGVSVGFDKRFWSWCN